MSKVVLTILILGGILFWWHYQNTPEQEQRKKLVWKTGLSVLIVISILLVVTGRMHWLGAVFAGFLAFLRQGAGVLLRYFPILTQLYRSRNPVSTVSTPILEMNMDHGTGQLSGKVLAGEFKGRLLVELDKIQLAVLRDYCSRNDMDSVRLLDSYLVSRFGSESGDTSDERGRTMAGVSSEMTATEALQVLGLSGSPSKEEITRAYRKLMQQLHPDRGGNEYFAAKANQAREVLLDKIS